MSGAKFILAVDIGTQGARAIAFDAGGNPLARAQRAFEPTCHSPQPGWAEQPPEVYWEALAACVRELWTPGLRPGDAAGLAVTTQRATMVCLDAGGQPLRPAIVWLDQRRCDHPPPLGPFWTAVFALGGASGLVRYFQREAEANWLAEHQPVLWRQTRKYLFLSGYLGYRLTGEFVDSVGSQVGFVPFDYRHHRWAPARDWKWRAVPIRPDQLPRLVAPGAELGRLTRAASETLGLPPGLPVIAAAADKACEVLGSGAVDPDVAALSFGTSATINTTQPRYLEVQRMLPAYPAALPGRWNTEVQLYRGFWMVGWFKREFAHLEQALARERGVPAEALLDEMVRQVPPGAEGLVLQPFWSPGLREPGPEARGAIIGFGEMHTRAHVYRAVLEGLVYGLRAGQQQIERRSGVAIRRIVVAGGGSRSDVALQVAADVFGLPASRPAIPDASALGAAISAAVGVGLHRDYATAVRDMTRLGATFEPDGPSHRRYDQLFRDVYAPLYSRLRPLYRRLRRITGYPPGEAG